MSDAIVENHLEADRLIENSLARLCVDACRCDNGRYGQCENFSYTDGASLGWFNKIFNVDVRDRDVAATVDAMMSGIAERRLPNSIMVTDNHRNRKVIDGLLHRDFALFHRQAGMMYDGRDRAGREENPCIQVMEEGDIDEWVRVLSIAFEEEKTPGLYRKLQKNGNVVMLGYRCEGQIASTLLMHLAEGRAGLHLIGTRPEYRGRGFAPALTRKAIEMAGARGIGTLLLQSSQMGEPIYRKIGFRRFSDIHHLRYPRAARRGPARED